MKLWITAGAGAIILIWTIFNFHFPGIEWIIFCIAALAMIPLRSYAGPGAFAFLYAVAILNGVAACVAATFLYTAGSAVFIYKQGIPHLVKIFSLFACSAFLFSATFHFLNPINFWFAAATMVVVSFLMYSIFGKALLREIVYLFIAGAISVALISQHNLNALVIIAATNMGFWWALMNWRMRKIRNSMLQTRDCKSG